MPLGKKYGGRTSGTKNKVTVQNERIAAEIAARTVADAKASGRKLAKEVLEDFMHLFAGMAATYQPYGPKATVENPHKHEGRFRIYAELAISAAKELAKYQSPTFKAIAVIPPQQDLPRVPATEGNVVRMLDDPEELQRVYQRMLRRAK